MTSKKHGITWKVGMKVKKIYYGIGGYKEKSIGTITKIDSKNNIIYVNDEHGVTFDKEGMERENFFPGIHQEISPISDARI